MESDNLIDFAPYIKPRFCDDLLNLEFNYDKNREINRALHSIFYEEKTKADKLFDEWFDKTYAKFFQEVYEYIDESLFDKDKNSLFPGSNSYLVQAACLILGMQATDHLTAIDRLEFNISNQRKSVKIYRIKPELNRKAQFINIIKEMERSNKLLVIVEKTESMAVSLLESFIDSLYGLLDADRNRRITVLFCMSSNFKPLSRLLPITVTTRMQSNKLIVAELEDISRNIDQHLINVDCGRFRMTTKLITLITNNFLYVDPTLANLKYLYRYSMFRHFRQIHTIAFLNSSEIDKLLKCDKSSLIIRSIKNLTSIQEHEKDPGLKKCLNLSKEIRSFITQGQNNAKFSINQISYYYYLLKDELGEIFPSYLNDLYLELMTHDDLGCSFKFADAIQKIRGYSSNSIMKRIDKALENCEQLEFKDDVRKIFIQYKKKFENNDDSNEIKHEFINSLLNHSQKLENPLYKPLCETLYCGDYKTFEKRVMPKTRFDAFKDPIDPKTYFEVIYASILKWNEEISEADLYAEFKQFMEDKKIEELKLKKRIELNTITPNKRARKSVHFEKIDEKSIKEACNLDEGLVKAIFIDTLDSIEQQGLVKRVCKDSKKGIIRRRVWP